MALLKRPAWPQRHVLFAISRLQQRTGGLGRFCDSRDRRYPHKRMTRRERPVECGVFSGPRRKLPCRLAATLPASDVGVQTPESGARNQTRVRSHTPEKGIPTPRRLSISVEKKDFLDRVVKNKLAPPFREAEFEILYGVGINQTGELLDLAATHSLIDKNGGWYSIEGERMGQGRDRCCSWLVEHPERAAQLRARLSECLSSVGVPPVDNSHSDSPESEEQAAA